MSNSATAYFPSPTIREITNWHDRPHQLIRFLIVECVGDSSPCLYRSNNDSIKQKFEAYARKWKEDTLFDSSISKRISHPSYQAIIAMGAKAIPFILDELEKDPDYWFAALRAITTAQDSNEINPVSHSSKGNLSEMADAWVGWGKQEGYI